MCSSDAVTSSLWLNNWILTCAESFGIGKRKTFSKDLVVRSASSVAVHSWKSVENDVL